ncbi:MAG: response regulator [Solirubrobacteraceae bacterium]|nr:MAG: DNA-binding response regulator [Solirubrobacterales bacterium]
MTAIRVLIADDHAVVRQGLRTLLELQEDIAVVGDVADGAEAVAAVRDQRPDVVLMDLVMPGTDGVEAIRQITDEYPATRVIALTSFLDDDKVFPAVRAGAAGYLLKDVQPQDLVRAIHTVYGGEALLHPAVAARLMEEIATHSPLPGAQVLTPREQEVLELIARGLSNKRIALELGIAEKTVKIHVSSVLRKLGVADRTQAALHAVRERLVDPQ